MAFPALVGMSANFFLSKTDVIMIAPLASLTDVGLYSAAQRVTFIQSFPIVALSTVLTPRISKALAQKDHDKVCQLFFVGLVFAAAVAGSLAIGLIMFQNTVMVTLFGTDYTQGAQILAVLALAQLAACLTFPTTSPLLMGGGEKAFGTVTVTALAINVAGNLLLVPKYGAWGGALATAMSTTLLLAVQLWYCRRALMQFSTK